MSRVQRSEASAVLNTRANGRAWLTVNARGGHFASLGRPQNGLEQRREFLLAEEGRQSKRQSRK